MIAFLLTLALLVTHAVAQTGNLAEIPIFLTATGTANDSEILHTNVAGSPATPVAAEDATYSRSLMFPNSNLTLASFSRGVSLFPISWNGNTPYYDPASVAWTFLIFAVKSGTKGEENGWYPAPAEKHLYAYQNGSELPDHLADRVDVIRDGDAMGVSSVTGCDSYAYFRLLGPDTGDEGDLQIYFTVDPATAGPNYRASDIYTMTYDTNAQAWSPIRPYKTESQLGLQPGDAIDGLCVDADSGNILLSLATTDVQDELRLYVPNAAGGAKYSGPLLMVGGELFVEDKLDFGSFDDGITGICADDPRLPDGNKFVPDERHLDRIRSTSYPLKSSTASTAVGFSAHRDYMKVNTERVDFYELNASIEADPFTGNPPPAYIVKFQTKKLAGWRRFATKHVSSTIGSRVSAMIQVNAAGPPVQSNSILGKPIFVRVKVVHPVTQAVVFSFTHSFWR